MAVARRSAHALAQEVRLELNRPEEDDMFDFPDSYYRALTKAHNHIRRMVADKAPDILSGDGPYLVTTSDSGSTYDLGDNFIGPIGVWEPPGPPTGTRILPALAEQFRFGFWVEGTTLHLTHQHAYSPGLYVTGVKVNVSDMDADNTHTLPEFMEQALIYRAAYEMARTPGMLVDQRDFMQRFQDEWRGERGNPQDTGVLGMIAKRFDYEGVETASSSWNDGAWWRGIGR